jgi:hypothetical protein
MSESTSVSGITGTLSTSPVGAAVAPPVTDWFNPKAFGAKGDGKADDTAALQAALDACSKAGGGTVYIPSGTFNFTKLSLHSHTNIQGSNSYAAILQYTGDVNQSWIQGVDMEHLTFRDLGVNGVSWTSPPSGSGHGFDLTRSANPDTHFVTFENVHVQNCGGSAFRISNAIVTAITRSVATNCGRGFELYGIPNGAAGTSVDMRACYANNCMHEGYALSKMVYTHMAACAADHNGVGYSLDDCDGITLCGCGAEVTAAKNGLDGTGVLVNNSRGIAVNSFFTWSNSADAVRVQGGSQNVLVQGCVENEPTGSATASVKVMPGSAVQLSGNTGVSPVQLNNK